MELGFLVAEIEDILQKLEMMDCQQTDRYQTDLEINSQQVTATHRRCEQRRCEAGDDGML